MPLWQACKNSVNFWWEDVVVLCPLSNGNGIKLTKDPQMPSPCG
jgi:hypothetical protein